MSHGQTPPVGLQVMSRAFSRFAHVIGFVCLSGAILDLLGFQSLDMSRMLWPALFPLLATFVALVLLDRRRTLVRSLVFLAVGGAAQLAFVTTILLGVAGTSFANTPALSLVAITLSLVAGPGIASSAGILWSLAGFVVGTLASLGAELLAGARLELDLLAVLTELSLVIMLGVVGLTRSRRLSVRPDLDRAAMDEQLADLRYRIEVRAAALMHDMVLNHLAAIAAEPGEMIHPELRIRIEKDLDFLAREEWLGEPEPATDSTGRTGWRRSALQAAVQEARALPLTVDVTGDLAAVARLSPERDTALGLAVKQCLVNVVRHAEVESAEVVVIGSDAEVSVMVIDAGRGFSEQSVASDRLGLRQSVHRRIESVGGAVQVWSTPGRGTTVMLRVPAATERVRVDD